MRVLAAPRNLDGDFDLLIELAQDREALQLHILHA
jgi:hypothetical protein